MLKTGDPVKEVTALLQTLLAGSGLQLQFTCKLEGDTQPSLEVRFTGPDAPLLIQRNGELLHAFEALAVAVLRLSPEEHDQVSFDALQFKAKRLDRIRREAAQAVSTVRATGRPYAFRPMNSRERRLLHLELSNSGLRTVSTGEGAQRFVVVHPDAESLPAPSTSSRADEVRAAFRRR
jgi:spoIIIJ-associated protein